MAEILIVDDDAETAELLGSMLTDCGYRVRTAGDGKQGLDTLSRRPDLVLLDVEMPMLDGPGMAQEMCVRDCGLERIPIVLLSGVVGLAGVARRVGTPYFLAKPYSIDAVIALCRRALSERVAPKPVA
jgi:CheY-like chemotaxis protein